ncbi:hypothetical protein T06_16083 [Trichinella sp. T6]|nr:hypothetical protein T06_16083 [Trichinella sp. T6]
MQFISAQKLTSAQRRDNYGKRLLQVVYRLTAHPHVRLRVLIIYSKTANLVKHCTSALHAMWEKSKSQKFSN